MATSPVQLLVGFTPGCNAAAGPQRGSQSATQYQRGQRRWRRQLLLDHDAIVVQVLQPLSTLPPPGGTMLPTDSLLQFLRAKKGLMPAQAHGAGQQGGLKPRHQLC